jgi:chromosomal replication initiation ATPase DnaA
VKNLSDLSKQMMKNFFEKKKDMIIHGLLDTQRNYKIFDKPITINDLICQYCGKQEFVTSIQDPNGSELQRQRRIAICASSECCSKIKPKKLPYACPVNFDTCGIPESHKHATLENYQWANEEECSLTIEFLKNKEWSYTFWGNSGRGKTHLAIGLLRKFKIAGLDAACISVDKIFGELREAQVLNENEYRVIWKYGSMDMLLLDDIGTERGSDWQLEKLKEILTNRERNQKKTIFTTNLTLDEFQERYGTMLTRRISTNACHKQFK